MGRNGTCSACLIVTRSPVVFTSDLSKALALALLFLSKALRSSVAR